MSEKRKILVIYPEVHSTQIAVYLNMEPIFLKAVKHSPADLAKYAQVADQKDYRKNTVLHELDKNGIDIEKVRIIMARSGLIKPVEAGVYRVNEAMVKDLKDGVMGVHATNLGGLIAFDIAEQLGIEAYMADPIVVDELSDLARVTGHPEFERKSIFHALSHKHFSRKYAKTIHKDYEELNLIVCHVGMGGISIGAHQKGRVVDVNQAFDGGGPFSITRTGTLPVGQLVRYCFSGKHTEQEVMNMITSKGGYAAYLGTDNINEINDLLMSGDEKAVFYSLAMAYQVSKEIASLYAVLKGELDAILLTGNIFNSERFLEDVRQRVGKLAPLMLYPLVNDFEAHAANAMRVIKGEVQIKTYH